MNKDVIYIDVEDDITAIIDKIKSAKENIIALVPPKRVGVLQSAVNLRLLTRAAKQVEKRVVLITSNQALISLAAAASIPVAKNLQSKPEIAEIAALEVDDGNDVIDGEQLPVGEHAAIGSAESTDAVDDADTATDDTDTKVSTKKKAAASQSVASKKSKKVPNFNAFRKKLALGITAGVLLVAGFVWAIFFAPAATVIISANTESLTVNDAVELGTTNDIAKGVVTVSTQSVEREASVEFEATGEKDVGSKATGSVRFTTSSSSSKSVAAGTELTTSGGLVFVVTADVTVPAATLSFSCGGICPGETTASVTAAEPGTNYNAASGSLNGSPSNVSAAFTGPTSGGTTKIVSVVTAGDVQKAKQALVDQSTDEFKQELRAKFDDSYRVIDDSFKVDRAAATSSPAVGEEAGKATLKSKTTYSLQAIAKSDLEQYLTAAIESQLEGDTNRKVYASGADDATLSEYSVSGDTATVRVQAEGRIGPTIDENEIKELAAGKRLGEIQSDLESRQGITAVDVKFSYFWVRTVPADTDKITIQFDLSDGEN